MQKRSTLLGITLTLFLSACLSTPPETGEDLHSVSEAVKATPRYQQAKRFDAFLKNELSPEDRELLLEACRSKDNSENPFCFSVNKERLLRKHVERVQRAAEPTFRTKPEPFDLQIAKGKILNWSAVQKASLKGLLAGMRTLTLEELRAAGRFALKRKECPNHVSIATAALLEIHLPFENVGPEIAALYEKGAKCTRRKTANHEHFLTRAALFHMLDRKPDLAEKVLAKVVPADAYSGRALYWLSRARLAQGKTTESKATLDRLKSQLPFSFHALMVRAQENSDPLLNSDFVALPTRSKTNHQANNLIEQAETLREMGFADSASQIVTFALTRFAPSEPPLRAYLATLGNTSTQIRNVQALLLTRPALRTPTYFQLAYPKAYFELFESHAGKVDPFLLLAIARKESTMDPNAVSPANAQGLLQLNPDTAKRLSGEELNLFDPRINAELAARYLNELYSHMKGQLPLIVASYNAGEQSVANWTQRYPTTDLLLFIDLIPYRETRDYVGYVLSNYFWYKRLYTENAQQALAQLSTGELAKVDEPRGVRSIKSLMEEALKTSESWPDDQATSPAFIDIWNQPDSTSEIQ